MSIRKKLYWGFGLILITVFGLFLVNMFAVLHEHSARDTAKKAVEMVQAMSKLEQVRQQNRLRLRNFLLNGDTKEFDALTEDGMPANLLERVHAPIGLDIGAVTPQESAVSILAEHVV